MSESLHLKYRPQQLDEVIGQAEVVKVLDGLLNRNETQAFLFCGPSGVGKTTLARIVAWEMGCNEHTLLEIDGATYTGIDKMRLVQDGTQYMPLGKVARRAVIIDECHRLSGQAWDSLLKTVEEPRSHVSWMFCTTNISKVPNTIKTRCATLQLKPISDDDLIELVDYVAKEEKIKLVQGVGSLVVKQALGSARQALVNLSLVRDITNKSEAARVLKAALDSDPVLQLCQFLIGGRGSWGKVMGIVNRIDDHPEGVRIVVVNYVAKVLATTTNDEAARRVLHILDAFATPYNDAEKQAPLLLSIGQALWGGE